MLRVLIIDDDPQVARAAQEDLARQGCWSESALSLPSALRRLREESFDLVVIDRADGGRVRHVLDAFQLSQRCGFVVLRPAAAAWWLPSLMPEPLRRARSVVVAVTHALQRFVTPPVFTPAWSDADPGPDGARA